MYVAGEKRESGEIQWMTFTVRTYAYIIQYYDLVPFPTRTEPGKGRLKTSM